MHPTRAAILTAAQRLFHERGFHATSMADLLAASGTGAGSFYYHFPGKDAVLTAVLDHLHERLDREVLAVGRAPGLSPVGRVRAIFGFYRAFLTAAQCRLGCPVGNLAGELADSAPEVAARLHRLFAAWRTGIADCLKPVADRLPAPLTLDDVTTFVLTVMEGAVMQARVARDLLPFDQSVQCLTDWLCRLFPDDPVAKPRT
ncbi:MAG: TetR/AcrR family transcriptional regulator [Planctomycetes bacterium]|nr:TetR/AcrR family transcriptional regulator [Planctomycetota bacterium]